MKNEIRLHDGELNVIELLWSNKELAAIIQLNSL